MCISLHPILCFFFYICFFFSAFSLCNDYRCLFNVVKILLFFVCVCSFSFIFLLAFCGGRIRGRRSCAWFVLQYQRKKNTSLIVAVQQEKLNNELIRVEEEKKNPKT